MLCCSALTEVLSKSQILKCQVVTALKMSSKKSVGKKLCCCAPDSPDLELIEHHFITSFTGEAKKSEGNVGVESKSKHCKQRDNLENLKKPT